MVYYKKIERTIKVDGKERKPIKLRAEIFSYDKQVSKFVFTLTNEEYEFDLTAASTLVALEYSVDGQQGSIEAISGVESIADSQIYFIVPEKLRGFVGTVKAGVYVNLKSGEQIDIQNIQFKMSKSMIDSMSGPAAEVYFESFNDVLVKVKAAGDKAIVEVNAAAKKVSDHADQKIKEYDGKFTQSDQKMNELQQSQTNLSNQLNETNKKIDEADVYRRSETFSREESSANVIYQLIGKDEVELTLRLDFKGKVQGSLVENPHDLRGAYVTDLMPPSGEWGESVTASYERSSMKDGVLYSSNATVANERRQLRFGWNVLEGMTRLLGEKFFSSQGLLSVSQKVNFIRTTITELSSNVFGFGASATGNKLTLATWRSNYSPQDWLYNAATTANSVVNITSKVPGTSVYAYIDDNGNVYNIAYADPSDGVKPSTVNIDYAFLDIKIRISMNDFIQSMIAAYNVPFVALLNDAIERIEILEQGGNA